jgi:hypothetical protein
MEKSDYNNPVWRNLLLDNIQVNLNYLAAKILLSRWKQSLKRSSSPDQIEEAKREIFDLYFKSKEYPSAKKDLQLLLRK